jgi:hypothetical protein
MRMGKTEVPKIPSWDEWLAGTGLAADRLIEGAKGALSVLPDAATAADIEARMANFVANLLAIELPRLKNMLISELPKFAKTGRGPVAKSPTDGVV